MMLLLFHMCNNTLTCTRNVTDNVCVNSAFTYENKVHFENTALEAHMLNRTLHSLSFHMKFMKRDCGEFHKFHMK